MSSIIGSGSAVPPGSRQDDLWDGFFADHYSQNRMARRIFSAAGVVTRHAVANPLDEDVSAWTTGARMDRFVRDALPLGKDAIAGALDDAGMDAADIGMFVVASCTGYATPGLDILLARDLGMPDDIQRLMVGHMGCYAALPAIGAASDYVTSRHRPALVLCLELTSLHLQPRADDVDIEQVVAHALFGDAAAAVVLAPDRSGLHVVDVVAATDVANASYMTWDVTDHGFRMGLSPRVPDVLARHVRDVTGKLLQRNGIASPADVAGWAVHPGGPRILDVAQEQLGLPADAVEVSREVLRDYGNASSATVLLVLAAIERRGVAPGEYVVALAFGPGLTLYGMLLQQD